MPNAAGDVSEMSAHIYDDGGEGPVRPHFGRGGCHERRTDRRARARRQTRWMLAHLGACAALAIALGSLVVSAVVAASPGPPFPPPPADGTRVVDAAGAFSQDARTNALQLIAPVEAASGGRVFVYTQTKSVAGTAQAVADAQALLGQWRAGGSTANAAVLLFDVGSTGTPAHAGLATGAGFTPFLPDDERAAIVDDSMAGYLADGDLDGALTAGLSRLYLDVQVMAGGGCVGNACPTAAPSPPGFSPVAVASGQPSAAPAVMPTPALTVVAVPVGPPFPPPVTGRRIYDYAGVFSADTIAMVQATADAIEKRTGAQVVVYTQVKPGAGTADAEQDAIALMDQWGVGRKGFDDGLVILFDLDHSLRHGQVQLYAGPGFRASILTNAERQAIYQDDMLPFLRQGDMDGAILVAMSRVDGAATPSHAQSLQFARQVNAILGLVAAPLLFLLLGSWVVLAWFRHGRDPHELDDPSIYVAGPPAGLTPAGGAFILEGGPSRRALTTALLDLASRGEVSFREAADDEPGLVGLDVVNGRVEPANAAIANARPLGAAEQVVLADLRVLGHHNDGYLVGRDLQKFSSSVGSFNTALENAVIAGGWYAEPPRIAFNRWLGRGLLEITVAVVLWFVASSITSSGLGLAALGLLGAGILTCILARSMPARTMAGAMVQAMLAAYRRTLAKTMATARSLNQVVAEAQLPWLRTPDQAMVWATAMGLQSELADVLRRSLTDVSADQALASTTYFPTWYLPSAAALAASGAASGIAEPGGGLFSPSMAPDFGGMLAALGTIGNPPPSTSSGSSGGSSFSSGGSFGGGSSGGGGGGAGGGF